MDIELHKKWKFEDKICSGCGINEESWEEILQCDSFGENSDNVPYSWFYSSSVDEQVCVAKVMMKKLKNRKNIREEVTWWGEKDTWDIGHEILDLHPSAQITWAQFIVNSFILFWTWTDIIYIYIISVLISEWF